MGFWEDIYRLRKVGLIPRVWKRAHIREPLSRRYAKSTINTVPSNASLTREGEVIAGNYVKKGRKPSAWRLGIGAFSLIEDPDDDEATKVAERHLARTRSEEVREDLSYDLVAYSHPPSPPPSAARARPARLGSSEADYWAHMRGKPYTYIRPFDGVDLYD